MCGADFGRETLRFSQGTSFPVRPVRAQNAAGASCRGHQPGATPEDKEGAETEPLVDLISPQRLDLLSDSFAQVLGGKRG